MKKHFLLFLLIISFSGYAQNTINNYKYVLVPKKYSFLKQENQYKMNTLTKSLLEDRGFTVYFEGSDLPAEVAGNKCSALNVEILEKNSMFSTNLTLLLKDCQGNIVFKSKQGKSREKEYDVSYNLALRDAFTSLDEAHYVYNPAAANTADQEATVTKSITVSIAAPVPVSPSPATATTSEPTQSAGTLYAQPTSNGYQLIDTAPKIILTLFKTSVQDYFIAGNGPANGIVFKRNENWFFEYYKNGQLMSEKLSIKF